MITYTNQERKEIAQALRAAKRHLWRGQATTHNQEKFICWALEYVRAKYPIGVSRAKGVIETRLQNNTVLEEWLQTQGVTEEELTDVNVQKHRHAWVNLLIKEFSAPAQK